MEISFGNNKNLFALLAKKRSGKDTVADYLVENHGFIKLAIADPLKIACRAIFSFTEEQLYGNDKEKIDEYWNKSPREIFQFIGTDLLRNQFDKELWIKAIKKKYYDIIKKNPNAKVVVSDVRFQNELDAVVEMGCTAIKIVRPNINFNDLHSSEKGIDDIKGFHIILKNDTSVENLYKKVDHICGKI